MFQKQNLLNNFQLSYFKQNKPTNNIKSPQKVVTYSPKLEYFSPRKKQIVQVNFNYNKSKNNHIQQHQTNKNYNSTPYEQSSQSYSQYYNQRAGHNNTYTITNSISMGSGNSSNPSKMTRTQTSKHKLKKGKSPSDNPSRNLNQNANNPKLLNSIDQQQQSNIQKLKQKYSSHVSSNLNSTTSLNQNKSPHANDRLSNLKNTNSKQISEQEGYKNKLSLLKSSGIEIINGSVSNDFTLNNKNNNLQKLEPNFIHRSSNHLPQLKIRNGLVPPSKQQSLTKENQQMVNRTNLKTQYSKQKIQKYLKCHNNNSNNSYTHDHINQNSQSHNKTKIQKQHNNTNNNQTISFNNFNNSNSNNGYSKQGNSNNIRNNNSSKNGNVSGSHEDSNSRGQQLFHQYAVSPSQEYYSRTSDENLTSRNSYQQRGINNNLRNNRQNHHSSSSSTVNTQNRKTSSLSFDKFAKKKMLTFYQCQTKKYYKYNDQGYLTDREIELRQKIQKAAFQALDKIIIQQEEQDQSESQVNRLKKSKSQSQFIRLNKLKQQVNTQRKRLYQLYGKYQIQSQQSIQNTVGNKSYRTRNNNFELSKQQKQKSYNPSQLPPSSSLSKKRFIVKYKQDQNQNILGENQLLDDSYYQREQKSKAMSGGNEIRLGVIKKKQSKKQPIKRQNVVPKIDNGVNDESFLGDGNYSKANDPKSSEYYSIQNIKKSQLGSSNRLNPNEIQQKGISRIGGITSEQMLSSSQKINGSNNPSQKSLQQLSQSSISSKNNSNVNNSQNDRKKNPSNKDYKESFSQSFQSSKQSESYSKNTPQSQNQHQSSNQRSEPRSYSQKLQNLDMINSKFKKKSPRTQSQNLRQHQEYSNNLKQKSKGNLQIDSSLKLKTNTDKVNNNKQQGEIKILDAFQMKVLPNQNPSLTLQENFDEMYQEPSLQNLNSQGYLKKSVQQRSVKSSHIGLVQQKKLKHKSSKNSHSSKHGSQSAIQAQIQKKSTIKKWVRQSSSNLDQNSNQQKGIHSNINMKKNNKISLIDNIPTLKQSNQFNVNELKLDSVNIGNKNLNNLPNNRISLDKNNRLSFESGSINLNLQSAIHLHRNSNEKYLKSNNSKIQEKGQSKLLTSRADISENKSLSSKNDNKQLNQKKRQNFQLSRLAQQRESFRSKAHSRHSSKKSSISKKINLQKSINSNRSKNQQKYNIIIQDGKHKYGTLLNVNRPNAQKINNVSSSKLTISQKVQKSSIRSQQNQRSQRSINDYYNSSLSNQQNQYNTQMISFNLIQRAQQLLDLQDELHEKRKQLQNSQIMSQQFQDILAKIQGHIYMLRQILQIATTAADIYSQDSTWVIKSSFLSLKKYLLQKQKIVQCASGFNKKCCFKLSEYQLTNQDLKQVINHQQIQQLVKDLTKCNQMTQKFIQQYYEYLKQVFDSDFIQDNNKCINLRLFDDRTEIGVLLEEYKTQILALKEKTNQSSHAQKSNLGKDSNIINKSLEKSSQQQSVLQQQTEQRMKKRIFKLMEVGFLLSELTGNRIKVFTEQIDVNEQFQQYFNDNWPYFERIVKTFS